MSLARTGTFSDSSSTPRIRRSRHIFTSCGHQAPLGRANPHDPRSPATRPNPRESPDLPRLPAFAEAGAEVSDKSEPNSDYLRLLSLRQGLNHFSNIHDRLLAESRKVNNGKIDGCGKMLLDGISKLLPTLLAPE